MHFKENIWLKIDLITDKMKEAMVAKIAHQCSELFSDAMKLMQLASLKDLWPKVSSVCERTGINISPLTLNVILDKGY